MDSLNGRKPILLCGDGGLTRETLNSPARDINGDVILVNNEPQKLIDQYQTLFKVPRGEHKGQSVYWMDFWKQYTTGAGAGYEKFCAPKKKPLSVTMDSNSQARGSVIILCMENILAEKKADLGEKKPTAGQLLSEIEPPCLTLFHELFHVQFLAQLLSGKAEKCKNPASLIYGKYIY